MKNRLNLGSTQVMKISLDKTKAVLRSLRSFLRSSSCPQHFFSIIFHAVMCWQHRTTLNSLSIGLRQIRHKKLVNQTILLNLFVASTTGRELAVQLYSINSCFDHFLSLQLWKPFLLPLILERIMSLFFVTSKLTFYWKVWAKINLCWEEDCVCFGQDAWLQERSWSWFLFPLERIRPSWLSSKSFELYENDHLWPFPFSRFLETSGDLKVP